MPDVSVTYRVAGPTVQAFHRSDAFVRGLMGPIGSGKTSAMIMELLLRANAQAPGPDGVRRTRFVVVRNTYAELKSTTLKSFEAWIPQEIGKLVFDAPITFRIQRASIDIEFVFLALDREEDQRKLLSLECTGAWINEAREIPKPILDTLTGRVGRYPAKVQGGATWSGVILDTNPPDNEHWWYRLAEEDRPQGFEFFRQPAADSPDAENIANLPVGYYERIKAGKDADWLAVYVAGSYGYVSDGKPVFPSFRDSVHVGREPLRASPGMPLLLGVDFGLTPAAVIGQRWPDGQWLILDEFIATDCGIARFSESLSTYIAREYPNNEAQGWADPAGGARSQVDERTCLDVLKVNTGWKWRPAPDNSLALRLESVRGALNRLIDGKPGFLLSPKCSFLRKGFLSGYHYAPVRTGSGLSFHESPAKNAYSHPMDALQYLLSGGGEASVVMHRETARRHRQPPKTEYEIFS